MARTAFAGTGHLTLCHVGGRSGYFPVAKGVLRGLINYLCLACATLAGTGFYALCRVSGGSGYFPVAIGMFCNLINGARFGFATRAVSGFYTLCYVSCRSGYCPFTKGVTESCDYAILLGCFEGTLCVEVNLATQGTSVIFLITCGETGSSGCFCFCKIVGAGKLIYGSVYVACVVANGTFLVLNTFGIKSRFGVNLPFVVVGEFGDGCFGGFLVVLTNSTLFTANDTFFGTGSRLFGNYFFSVTGGCYNLGFAFTARASAHSLSVLGAVCLLYGLPFAKGVGMNFICITTRQKNCQCN